MSAVLGVFVLFFLVDYSGVLLSSDAKAEREIMRYYEDLEKQYANDTYGGSTPEETLEMFIAALEAGDIELASKYFLVDEREEIILDLEKVRNDGILLDVIVRIRSLSLNLSNKDNFSAYFIQTDENNVVEFEIVLKKNQNDVWKITEI